MLTNQGGNILNYGLFKSRVDLCWVCGFRVKVNSVLCIQCGKWIHGRYARVQMVATKFL